MILKIQVKESDNGSQGLHASGDVECVQLGAAETIHQMTLVTGGNDVGLMVRLDSIFLIQRIADHLIFYPVLTRGSGILYTK